MSLIQRHDYTTQPDGWLYMRHTIHDPQHGPFEHVQRIKWIDQKWLNTGEPR